MCEHGCRLGEGSLVPLPRAERQNPAGRRSPRRGFALAVLPFDRSIALSLNVIPRHKSGKAWIATGCLRHAPGGLYSYQRCVELPPLLD